MSSLCNIIPEKSHFEFLRKHLTRLIVPGTREEMPPLRDKTAYRRTRGSLNEISAVSQGSVVAVLPGEKMLQGREKEARELHSWGPHDTPAIFPSHRHYHEQWPWKS